MDTWPPAPTSANGTSPQEEANGWRRFYAWLFTAPQGKRSVWSILVWWELRRIPYNIIVGMVGVCSLFVIILFASPSLKPGEDIVEPMTLFIVPFLMNFCYTAGCVVEVLNKWSSGVTGNTGPVLLKVGIGFSLFVVCTPAVLATFVRFFKLFGGPP